MTHPKNEEGSIWVKILVLIRLAKRLGLRLGSDLERLWVRLCVVVCVWVRVLVWVQINEPSRRSSNPKNCNHFPTSAVVTLFIS